MAILINKDKYSLKTISVNKTEVYGTELIPSKTIIEKGRFIWSSSKVRIEEAKWNTKHGFVYAKNISENKDYHIIEGKLMTKPYIVIKFTNDTTFLERFESDEELYRRIEELKIAFKADMFEINYVVTNGGYYGGYFK